MKLAEDLAVIAEKPTSERHFLLVRLIVTNNADDKDVSEACRPI